MSMLKNKISQNVKKVLIVIYTFPPTGGAGVQRAVKFSKYLPNHNIDLTILTVKKILYHVYDESLLNEIHSKTKVVRTNSLDPLRLGYILKSSLRVLKQRKNKSKVKPTNTQKNKTSFGAKLKYIYRYLSKILFFIDPQILWLPFVLIRGRREIKKNNLDVIVSMSQPNSLILTCYLLSKWSKTPLVLDMRDPWTNDPYFKPPTSVHFWLYRKIEKMAYNHAQKIIVISESMKEAIANSHPNVIEKVIVLPNGFDSEDMASKIKNQELTNNIKIINYTGSLYVHHQPALQLFISSLEQVVTKNPNLREKIKVRFVGNVEQSNRLLINKSKVGTLFELTGYVKHEQAISYTTQAHVLLLFIKLDLDRSKDTITIPGKFFEYLGSQKPILYIGPKSETSDIILETKQGWTPPLSVDAIAQVIEQIITSIDLPSGQEKLVSKYDRKFQAKVFAKILHHIN